MTTVAFDGTFMAADSMATDTWGLKEFHIDKLVVLNNVALGCAGEAGQIRRWTRMLNRNVTVDELLLDGYPDYDKEKNDPSIILVDRGTGRLYRHVASLFMPCSRAFHAVGSGRDFALAAMACGKTAREAVEIAMSFDNGTGGEIYTERVHGKL